MEKIITDRGLILARLISGQCLTIRGGKMDDKGAWLNKWTEKQVEVDLQFAKELLEAKCLQLDSGNWETGERHYFFRVLTRKHNRKWRLDVTRDDETDRKKPLQENNQPPVQISGIPESTRKVMLKWVDARIRQGVNPNQFFFRTRGWGCSLNNLRESIETNGEIALNMHNGMLALALDLWSRDKTALEGFAVTSPL